MSEKKLSALDFAKYILAKQGEKMTKMKLQKLVYYSQVWCLVCEVETFTENIEAWVYGPVVRELWNETRDTYYVSVEDISGDASKLSQDSRKIVDSVLNVYGSKSAEELSDLTHAEDPWKDAWKRGKNTVITRDNLKRYYSKRLE